MTRILVTGSTGQVGRSVLALARRSGHEVHGLARGEPDPCDLTDLGGLDARLAMAAPDVVIHAAALTDVDRCEREPELAEQLNVRATARIARWCERSGAHLVYVSTNYAFDGQAPIPYPPAAATSPISVYGRTKVEGEQAAGPGASIARTAWITSAEGPSLVHAVLRRGLRGEAMAFIDDQRSQATVADDLAQALLHLATERRVGTWHLTNPEVHTPASLARLVLEAAALDPRLVHPAPPDHPLRHRAARRPANGVLDLASTRATHPALALPPYVGSLAALLPAVVGRLGGAD